MLTVCALAAVACAMIPFVDRWLVWGDWGTHSGLTSAWTLLLIPALLLLAVHALDLAASAGAMLTVRLLGPDPTELLDAWRGRARRLRDRERLAEHLHDQLGHELTVMVLQASAAQRTDDPGSVSAALTTIETAGRRAAAQLDEALGRLGGDLVDWDDDPGLAELDDVASGMRAAGAPTELVLSGHLEGVPPAVGAELHRVIQEACTNVLRHAGTVPTRIEVARLDEAVHVEVVNAPGIPDEHAPRGAGRGMAGMARRVRRLGGTVEQGATADGGYRVGVRVPLG